MENIQELAKSYNTKIFNLYVYIRMIFRQVIINILYYILNDKKCEVFV